MLSLNFKNVYINDYKSIVGRNEYLGNIHNVDEKVDDLYYGEKSFELAQMMMERNVIKKIIDDNNLIDQDIDLIIGGDLSNQITASTYGASKFNISFLGIYSACSTFIEGLILASSLLSFENVRKVINVTSSHNLSQEKQFRYPIEYGVLRNNNTTFTATGSVCCLLSKNKGIIKIKSATIGSIFDYEINDANMIGAIMAPSAAETLVEHLNYAKHQINYYDLIITGDLGTVGFNIFNDYLDEEFNIKANNIIDAGSKLYKNINEVNDGASGPSCLPLYFFNNILSKKKYKKILLVGTGSLHSSTTTNLKQNIPSISHVIEIEVM